ncbi:MAG: hypothetical protein FWD76_02505 [Firmicutes bacterium]|nr:hypothetical protein [Bacillota bacterium]
MVVKNKHKKHCNTTDKVKFPNAVFLFVRILRLSYLYLLLHRVCSLAKRGDKARYPFCKKGAET